MQRSIILILIVLVSSFTLISCTKPLMTASVAEDIEYYSRDYAAGTNEIYYAVRLALADAGYAVASENLGDGIITTSWAPVKSDSHCIDLFGRRDYGVNGAYHQLEVRVVPNGGRNQVKIGSRLKTIITRLHSTGIEERKILERIGDDLRKQEPTLTNLGIDE